MRKAIFFEEAYNQGILPTITEGYIFTATTPDYSDINNKLNPYLLKVVSYGGLKQIFPFEDGVKFQAQGQTMFCMIEPSNYTNRHIEPMLRSTDTTAYIPFRFSDCESFFSKDNKYKVLVPKHPYETFDSFTINFPAKGDIAVLYYIFDKDLEKQVFPFMEENMAVIIKSTFNLKDVDSKLISRHLMGIIKQYPIRMK